jgi:DNA-binding transcriptional ArsR family regulator
MAEELDKGSIKALSAETRQEIVKLLKNRPYTASELSKKLGKHVTTVSEHLNTLEKSDIVFKKDTGNKWRYYDLTNKGQKLFKPQFYSWVLTLAISVVGIFFGLGLIAGDFSYFSTGVSDTMAREAIKQVPTTTTSITDSGTSSISGTDTAINETTTTTSTTIQEKVIDLPSGQDYTAEIVLAVSLLLLVFSVLMIQQKRKINV